MACVVTYILCEQAHAETATLIAKNVCVPLVEISSHKKNESKQLCSYRDKFESLLQTGENNVEKVGGYLVTN